MILIDTGNVPRVRRVGTPPAPWTPSVDTNETGPRTVGRLTKRRKRGGGGEEGSEGWKKHLKRYKHGAKKKQRKATMRDIWYVRQSDLCPVPVRMPPGVRLGQIKFGKSGRVGFDK